MKNVGTWKKFSICILLNIKRPGGIVRKVSFENRNNNMQVSVTFLNGKIEDGGIVQPTMSTSEMADIIFKFMHKQLVDETMETLKELLDLKDDQTSNVAIPYGNSCDICNCEINASNREIISADKFKQIVRNGFNPFNENITHPLTGLPLSDLGAALGLSVEEQYENWKEQSLNTDDDWALCINCAKIAIHQ